MPMIIGIASQQAKPAAGDFTFKPDQSAMETGRIGPSKRHVAKTGKVWQFPGHLAAAKKDSGAAQTQIAAQGTRLEIGVAQ